MSDTLEPCPWCDGVLEYHHEGDRLVRVECIECECSGPIQEDMDAAALAWNKLSASVRAAESKDAEIARLRDVARAAEKTGWTCMAHSGMGGNEPQECDWPHCQCDPKAVEVLAALDEEGWIDPHQASAMKTVLDGHIDDKRKLIAQLHKLHTDSSASTEFVDDARADFEIMAKRIKELAGLVEEKDAKLTAAAKRSVALERQLTDCADRFEDIRDDIRALKMSHEDKWWPVVDGAAVVAENQAQGIRLSMEDRRHES